MFGILKAMFPANKQDDLISYIKKGALLIDVRSVQEFNSGSAKDAINIPLDQLSKQLGQLKDKENIIVFCRSGARSAQAKMILNKNGFESVVNGGSWQKVKSVKESYS